MKLYRTKGFDASAGEWEQKWDGTQVDASARRKGFKTDGLVNVETKEEDVPTDKAGLLTWLNAHCTGE